MAVQREADTRPNLIFLTVGCSNSTVVMRMLAAMGWNLADADERYAESVSCRAVNMRTPFDSARAEKVLAGLPQPWAVKDPRFSEKLDKWLPLLIPYRPFLLWVTKDHAYVRASFVRRFNAKPERADQRLRWCETYFAGWPWGKLRLDVDQIAAAVRLFDPGRAFAFAGTAIPAEGNAHEKRSH